MLPLLLPPPHYLSIPFLTHRDVPLNTHLRIKLNSNLPFVWEKPRGRIKNLCTPIPFLKPSELPLLAQGLTEKSITGFLLKFCLWSLWFPFRGPCWSSRSWRDPNCRRAVLPEKGGSWGGSQRASWRQGGSCKWVATVKVNIWGSDLRQGRGNRTSNYYSLWRWREQGVKDPLGMIAD